MHNRNLMRKLTSYTVALFSVLVLFTSCKKEYDSVAQIDANNINAYKKANSNLVFKDTAGYSYSITEPGTGNAIKNSDSVYYSYAFKSTSGKLYSQTNELMIPSTFLGYTDRFVIGTKSYVFAPVREVLARLKKGGKATLLLPSGMAFGKNGLDVFGIGSNETILVELGVYNFDKRHEADAFEIPAFISKNKLTFSTDVSGVLYNVSSPGSGTDVLGANTEFVCNYTGRYLDGTVFDSGTGQTFTLNQVIKGWQEVLPGKIKTGGKIRIIVPSHLAYGVRPLDFDIEITKIIN